MPVLIPSGTALERASDCTSSTVSEQQRTPRQSQENRVYAAGEPSQVQPEQQLESFPSQAE